MFPPDCPGRGPAASGSWRPQAQAGRRQESLWGAAPRGCTSRHIAGELPGRWLKGAAPLGTVALGLSLGVSRAARGAHSSVTFSGVEAGSVLGSGTLMLSLVEHSTGHPGSRAQVPEPRPAPPGPAERGLGAVQSRRVVASAPRHRPGSTPLCRQRPLRASNGRDSPAQMSPRPLLA